MSIRLATKAARGSKFVRARVGAVIVRGNRVLSSGCNRIGYSHILTSRAFPESIHAEQQAILGLLKERRGHELVGSTMYVSRVNNSGIARLSRPCSYCQRLIESVGIRRVIYTTNNGTEEL